MKATKKNVGKLVGGCVLACCLVTIIHAQVATTAPQPAAAGPSSDSVVQIAADESGLSLLDPAAAANLGAGTYWVAYAGQALVPMPFLPLQSDSASTPIVYSFGFNSIYLVDLTGGAVPQPTAQQTMANISAASLVQGQLSDVLGVIDLVQQAQANVNAASGGGMLATAQDSPLLPPGDGDDGGSTNGGGSLPMFSSPVDYGSNLCIIGFSVSSNTAVGFVSNTIADVSYEIQFVNNLASTQWQSAGFVLGSELTNWTAIALANMGTTSNAFFRIRSWIDSQNVGIPDWWQFEFLEPMESTLIPIRRETVGRSLSHTSTV